MPCCDPCTRGEHGFCTDVPHPDVEMTFVACSCLHDPVLIQRDAQVTALLVAAQVAFQRGDDMACATSLRRCLAVLDGKQVPKAPARMRPVRKLALVVVKPGPTTADCYAAASGEPIPDWMATKHDSERR